MYHNVWRRKKENVAAEYIYNDILMSHNLEAHSVVRIFSSKKLLIRPWTFDSLTIFHPIGTHCAMIVNL